MTEYLNGAPVMLAIVVGFIYFLDTKSKDFLPFFAFLVLLNIYYFSDNKENATKSVILFKHGAKLKCNTINSEFTVSKKDDYSYEEGYFIKESLLIHPVNCEQLSD